MREGGYITESPLDIHNSRERFRRAEEISIDRAGLLADPDVDNLCIPRRNARPYGQICDVFAKATLQNSQNTDPGAYREKLAQFEPTRTLAREVARGRSRVRAHAKPTVCCGQVVDDSLIYGRKWRNRNETGSTAQ
jgi:hypothetical protein